MAKLPNDLGQLENLIKVNSDGIDALKKHIQGLEEHIALSKNLEKQFRQNLSVLKDVNIISLASEFKKVKEDLARVSENISISSVDLKNSLLFLEKSEKFLAELKEKRDTVIESQGKVIEVRFGNKERE